MPESKKELEGNMKRSEALIHIAKAGGSVSYRYEHKKEVDEALEIAMKDISVMDKIIEIVEGDGKDEEKARAIMKVVKVAMIIFE